MGEAKQKSNKTVPFDQAKAIVDISFRISRTTVSVIDAMTQRGAVKGEELSAIGQLRESWVSQEKRVEAYKEYDLSSTSEANDLIIRAFQNGACSKTQIADIVGQWNTPNHDEFKDRNLYSLYNSFSEVWKGNLGLLPNRSTQLHALFDSVAETPEVVEV